MAEYTRTPLEELQEKLTSAIKDNTRAQAETMKASTATGKEIRRLQKDTARQQKQAAFLEKDLGAELGESLSAPFKTLANIIPKPLRILASMPIQAAMRGLTPAAPRTDPSGTILPSAGGTGVFKGALSETMGKQIADEGYVKGIASMFGFGGGPGSSPEAKALDVLVDLGKDHTKLLEKIVEKLEPPRKESFGKGAGFREPGIEDKILDPKTGRPFAAGVLGFGGGGGGGKGKPPGGDDDDGLIPDWMKTGATAGVAATGTWAIFRKGLLKFLGKGSLVGGAVVTTAMVIKDIYDLSTSAEERHQKGAENVGSMVGTGLGAGIGAVFGIPGMMVGAMLGNVIGEMIGKTIDAEKNPHIQAQLQALDVSLDELEDARKRVLKSEISNAQKQIELAKIEEQTIKLKDEEAAAKVKRQLIEAKKQELIRNKSILIDRTNALKQQKAIELQIALAQEAYEAGTGSLEDVKIMQGMLQRATNDMPEANKNLYNIQKQQVEKLELELETLREEAKEDAGESAVSADIEKILAKARGGIGKFAEQRAAGGVAGLHDVPVGKTYERHAKELMGEVFREWDPSQTKGAKAMEAMFGESTTLTAAGLGATTGPTGISGMGIDGVIPEGGKVYKQYTSDLYKAAQAASEGQEQVDDMVMAMTGKLGRGLAPTKDYSDVRGVYGQKTLKYSEIKELKDEYTTDKFLTSRGGQVTDEAKRAELGMAPLEQAASPGAIDPYTEQGRLVKRAEGNLWFDAIRGDPTAKVLGTDLSGFETPGYLPTQSQGPWMEGQAGGLGTVHEWMVDMLAVKTSEYGKLYDRLSGDREKRQVENLDSIVQTVSEREGGASKYGEVLGTQQRQTVGTSGELIREAGSGAVKVDLSVASVISAEQKLKWGLTETNEYTGGVSIKLRTAADGMYELALYFGKDPNSAKKFMGQIKTKEDVDNLIFNISYITSLPQDNQHLSKIREALMKSLKAGSFGMREIRTGVVQETPGGQRSGATSIELTEAGKEKYAALSVGGRGEAGRGTTGTKEYRRKVYESGFGMDIGEANQDLLDPESALNKYMTWGHTGPSKGERGTEDPSRYYGRGGTKPYMTYPAPDWFETKARIPGDPYTEYGEYKTLDYGKGGDTTYALPPSTAVKATALADPYADERRDASGRLMDLPQYRPSGVSDIENYPDYYWQKFGEEGHDPGALEIEDYSKLIQEYKASDPMSSLTVGGIPGATAGIIPGNQPMNLAEKLLGVLGLGPDEKTQEEIREADMRTADVLTDVKIGTKSSLAVTPVDKSGKILDLLGSSGTKTKQLGAKSDVFTGEEIKVSTFIGESAKDWDPNAAARAMGMMQDPLYDKRKVWQDTGTLKMADEHLRQEISDKESGIWKGSLRKLERASAAEYGPVSGKEGLALGELISHPKLFENYPDMARVRAVHDPNMDPGTRAYAMPGKGEVGKIFLQASATMQDILHELQHLVDDWEGHGGGMWDSKADRIAGETGHTSSEIYWGAVGERSAFNTENRYRMDEEQRGQTYPKWMGFGTHGGSDIQVSTQGGTYGDYDVAYGTGQLQGPPPPRVSSPGVFVGAGSGTAGINWKLDETTQDEIKEADKTTADVLSSVKIGSKSSLGVTLVDSSGMVLELGQSLTKQSDVMYQGRMEGGEFTPEASGEERFYGGLGGMMTKIGSGKLDEITDKELVETQTAATDYQSEIAQVLSDVKIGNHSTLGVTIAGYTKAASDLIWGGMRSGYFNMSQEEWDKHGTQSQQIEDMSKAGTLPEGLDPDEMKAMNLALYMSKGERAEKGGHIAQKAFATPAAALYQMIQETGRGVMKGIDENKTGKSGLPPIWEGIKQGAKATALNVSGLWGQPTAQELEFQARIGAPVVGHKSALLNQAAMQQASQSGGGTSVVVNAPSTSNSNSTVQKIDSNPLVSRNPRQPIGVHYG